MAFFELNFIFSFYVGYTVSKLGVLNVFGEEWTAGNAPTGRARRRATWGTRGGCGAPAAGREAGADAPLSCRARGLPGGGPVSGRARAGSGAALAVLAGGARCALCNAEAAVLPTCPTSSRGARRTNPTPRRYAHRPRCTFTTPRMQSTYIFASRSDKRIDDESDLWRRMRTNLTANAVSTSRSRLLFSY